MKKQFLSICPTHKVRAAHHRPSVSPNTMQAEGITGTAILLELVADLN